MKNLLFITFCASLVACNSVSKETTQQTDTLSYPKTIKDTITDTYFGTKISDPYRWLEDDLSRETAAWVKEQNKVTADYLNKIPFREKIKQRLTQLWNFPKNSAPFKKGKYTFFTKNNGVQNQSVLYVQEGLTGEPRMLLDPNTLSADGTVALTGFFVSQDAKYMAYGISKAGSDWNTYDVLEIATGKKLTDHIEWAKFTTIAWLGNGFYYSRFEAPKKGSALSGKNEFSKVYFHQLGDEQHNDQLVFEDKVHPLHNFSPTVTDDGRYLIINITESTSGNQVLVKDLTIKGATFIPITQNFDADFNVIDNIGNKLLVHTNKNAPKFQLVIIDPAHPQPENWKKILPETADLLQSVERCSNKLIAKYLKDVSNHLYVYNMEGKQESEIKLPGLCTVKEFNSDKNDSLAFYSTVSFTTPGTIYKYNIVKNISEAYFKTAIDFNSDDYETKQVFYPGKDGQKIPLFITHKKGLKPDAHTPCFLYGYGGFNISLTPEFRIDRAILLENGGVYAVANLRGGGEYGEAWHKAGTKCNKQQVFDDFIAAAEYLVKEGYTSSSKLAIHGRSNGGLLIGAVLTQRPDLAKVALPAVGVLDMLRYHKFTIGYAWASDYGTSENKEEFDCLVKYSPLHNVKNTNYPATLILTGDHDDRVVPAHSFKFAATLQEKCMGPNPSLIRIDVNAGHGSGKPTTKQIDELADMWAFVLYNLGSTFKD